MRSHRRRHLLVYSVTILSLGALAFLANVYAKASQERLLEAREKGQGESAEQAVGKRVKVLRVFSQPLTDILALPGSVEAYDDIELATKRAGTVEWIGADEGNRVRAGEKLVQLDFDILRALVDKARTDYRLAELKFDRTQRLFSESVVSTESFDEAEANLKAARAILDEASAQWAESALYSPINGILDRRYLDRGEHIREGQCVVRIVDIDRVKVIFNVPEKDIRFFEPGQTVEIQIADGEPRSCTGIVEHVAMAADLPARTFPLKVLVENRSHCLRPGMIVRGSLIQRRLENGIAAPFYSIVEREDGKSVFVVEDGKAAERPIRYGMVQNGMVEIVEGLEEGDALVVVGQRDLVQGQSVSIAADLTEEALGLADRGQDLTGLAMQ